MSALEAIDAESEKVRTGFRITLDGAQPQPATRGAVQPAEPELAG